MNKEQKEFLISQHKAGLRTNTVCVCPRLLYGLRYDSTANTTIASVRLTYAEVKITSRLQLVPTCVDKPPHSYMFYFSKL